MAKHSIMKEELQEAFTMHCSSENTIPPSKLGVVYRSIGRAPTEAQLRALSSELENKGVHALNFQQTEAILTKNNFPPESSDTVLEAFRIFDKEGNGFIRTSEIRHILCNLGEKLTEEEVDEMIREIDQTDEGHFNFEEFVRTMQSGH